MPDIVLAYTGGGYGGALPLIPARDLTAADLELEAVIAFGGPEALIASGHYVAVSPKTPAAERKQAVGPAENKAVTPATDDKAVQ